MFAIKIAKLPEVNCSDITHNSSKENLCLFFHLVFYFHLEFSIIIMKVSIIFFAAILLSCHALPKSPRIGD